MQPMKIEVIEQIATAGSRTSWWGGVFGAVGAFLASNLVGILGVLVALLGFLVNVHFRRKADRRMQAESELRQRRMQMQIDLMNAAKMPLPIQDTDLGTLEAAD